MNIIIIQIVFVFGAFIKIDGYVISRFIRNLIGRKRYHAVAMCMET